ncbi:hypothetical protein BD626DRAFT_503441 [Schizophyllum amplum]|uniref:Probable RNA-binding protein 18 n=1 Tax=Schizophyllum amplum TaxID=97359 RepID=A0A550C870_9AGAR|nr:hypothetical protein BD626DRAFT_503441 [Auriculariopsis ampla]
MSIVIDCNHDLSSTMMTATTSRTTLDEMDVDLDSHLSYPVAEAITLPPSTDAAAPARALLKERLYVGNLHPTVDEYTLIRLFQRYGKVSRLDFLFHKAGPHRGKPRGYAFVEYGSTQEATSALTSTHDRLLRGRRLVVTYAQHAPTDGASYTHRSQYQPTSLSILKSAQTKRHGDKIALMEAKLRQMGADEEPSRAHHAHPSLPAKPPPTLESLTAPRNQPGDTSIHPTQQRPLPQPNVLSQPHASQQPQTKTAPSSKASRKPSPLISDTPSASTLAQRPSLSARATLPGTIPAARGSTSQRATVPAAPALQSMLSRPAFVSHSSSGVARSSSTSSRPSPASSRPSSALAPPSRTSTPLGVAKKDAGVKKKAGFSGVKIVKKKV